MRVPFLLAVLLLSAGCGATTPKAEPAAPPPLNPGDAVPETPTQDAPPVAYIDDQPVTWKAVVDHAMTSRGRELIDKYILWKLRQDRLEELQVRNTPDDLRRRAQLWIDAMEKQVGAEGIQKKLDEMKMTKKDWVERFMASAEFDEHRVAGPHERVYARGDERHAVFIGLDFPGNTDLHSGSFST